MYAVFFLRAGKWVLWQEFGTARVNAEDEARYLRDGLGLVAKVFKRIGS